MLRPSVTLFRIAKPALVARPAPVRYRHTIVDSAKETLDHLNKKIGQVAAAGLENAEQVAGKTAEAANVAKEKGSFSSTEVKKEASNMASDMAADAKGMAKDAKNATKEAASSAAEATNEHTQRVKENFKGYESLQDKGTKTESEQNRPDDAVGPA